jgi:hypothetical protein
MIATMAMITNKMLIFFDLPLSLDLANETLPVRPDSESGVAFGLAVPLGIVRRRDDTNGRSGALETTIRVISRTDGRVIRGTDDEPLASP